MTDPIAVGRVRAVLRYPVKSMGPAPALSAQVGWHGVRGDRRWAFVRDDAPTTFPWLTIRQLPQMAALATSYADPDDPERGPVLVTLPTERTFAVTDPALAADLSARHGSPVRVVGNERGFFDVMPVALITSQAISAMAARANRALNVLRFRPNLIVEASTTSRFRRTVGSDVASRLARVQTHYDCA